MTLTHHESAESYLTSAENRNPDESQHFSTLATAHGILALIELIQNNLVGDEEAADFDPIEFTLDPTHLTASEQTRRVDELEKQSAETIRNLQSQLDGARAVARNHETTIETQHRIIQRCVDLATKWCDNNGGTLQAYGQKVHEAITGIPITITNDGKNTNG